MRSCSQVLDLCSTMHSMLLCCSLCSAIWLRGYFRNSVISLLTMLESLSFLDLQEVNRGGARYLQKSGWSNGEITQRHAQKIIDSTLHRKFSVLMSLCRSFSLSKRLFSSVAPAQQNHSNNAKQYDVIMAGGGIVGCCAAYFLAQRVPPTSLCVIERDLTVCIEVVHVCT